MRAASVWGRLSQIERREAHGRAPLDTDGSAGTKLRVMAVILDGCLVLKALEIPQGHSQMFFFLIFKLFPHRF